MHSMHGRHGMHSMYGRRSRRSMCIKRSRHSWPPPPYQECHHVGVAAGAQQRNLSHKCLLLGRVARLADRLMQRGRGSAALTSSACDIPAWSR